MSQKQALVPVEQRSVDFYGDEVTAVLIEENDRRQIFVPVRSICDYLGLSWSGQRERINRDPVLSDVVRFVRVTRANSPRGNPILALPLNYRNNWRFGVNVNRQ
ncbi:MAG: hypothetical protein HF973_08835 [Chloroflexi bacterium]|nr:hypothetical protein [Chloroflexota bacterium]